MSESSENTREKRKKIKKRIDKLHEKSGVKFYASGETWPGDKLTVEEQEELKQLYEKLSELNNGGEKP